MKLMHTIAETHSEISRARREGKAIGLVPTMGALHEGHMTLIRRAREQCDFVVVSVFVNPAQFGQGEDLDKYPRTLEADVEKCREAGVDLVFAPAASDMYPAGFATWIEVGKVAEVFEGRCRPGHFRGVATVCNKLFNITAPDYAYFGMKDYQQLLVIRKMVRDLNIALTVVAVETVRESDGLAMSSRNVYLSSEQRNAALVLSQSLVEAKKAFDMGERGVQAIQDSAENIIKAEPMASADYVAVADAETLEPVARIERPVVVLLAVRIGRTRLIDNMVLCEDSP